MCKVLPAPARHRPPSESTRLRRATAAAKQAPLPLDEQRRRAEVNRAAHLRRHPLPPQLDPLSQVRGDPRGKDEPAPKRPVVRSWGFADLLGIFDVSGAVRFRKVTGYPPQKKAA